MIATYTRRRKQTNKKQIFHVARQVVHERCAVREKCHTDQSHYKTALIRQSLRIMMINKSDVWLDAASEMLTLLGRAYLDH